MGPHDEQTTGGNNEFMYRRPTFKCVVKRLRFRVFKETANSNIAFWARLDSSPLT